MGSRDDRSDGLAQLSEMMRAEQTPSRVPRGPRTIDPARRRRRRRGTLIATAITVVVVGALVASYATFTLTAPVGHATATLQQPSVAVPPAATVQLTADDGESAISVTGAPDYLGANGITQSTGETPMPMASISKLITAMVILQAKPLTSATDPGPTITFSKADHDLYDTYYVLNATIAPMPTGSTLSEHDALATMLVVSACNYAEALAEWAYGSEGAFLSATRKWLAAHGMTHTVVDEPTGLDHRNTSTPSDLLALGRLATANPAIAAIVAQPTLHVTSAPASSGLQGMSGTNDLLGTDGIDGLKTGTLDTGSDLLYSAHLPVPGLKDPLTIVGVVLDGYSRSSVDDAVEATLRSIVTGFHQVDLGRQGDVVGTYTTRWGASARMVLDGSPSTLTWSNTPVTAKMTTTTLTTGSGGQKVGTVTWTAGKATVSEDVVLDGAIRPPSAWWRLTHPFELGT